MDFIRRLRDKAQVLDFLSTLLLCTAGLATSWVTYQSARWSGLQAARFTEANVLRTYAAGVQTEAGLLESADLGLFLAWVTAVANGNGQLQTFERARFREEFRPAFEAWLATDPIHNKHAPPSPFVMPEYRSKLGDSARVLVAASARAFGEAEAANRQSDLYTLDAVILASVLFFAGIAPQAVAETGRTALLAFALIGCVVGVVHIFQYPVR
jgi:hypothetical protein